MMSYVSVYENKTPRAKGIMLAGAVHVVIVAAVIAMPGIEIPDKFNGPFVATPIAKPQPPEPVIKDEPPEPKLASLTLPKAADKPITDVPVFPIHFRPIRTLAARWTLRERELPSPSTRSRLRRIR